MRSRLPVKRIAPKSIAVRALGMGGITRNLFRSWAQWYDPSVVRPPLEVRTFTSFDDADRAERQTYRLMSPDERLAILLELIARQNEASGEATAGFARVCRVAELPPG